MEFLLTTMGTTIKGRQTAANIATCLIERGNDFRMEHGLEHGTISVFVSCADGAEFQHVRRIIREDCEILI